MPIDVFRAQAPGRNREDAGTRANVEHRPRLNGPRLKEPQTEARGRMMARPETHRRHDRDDDVVVRRRGVGVPPWGRHDNPADTDRGERRLTAFRPRFVGDRHGA